MNSREERLIARLQEEFRRMVGDSSPAPDPALVAEGWERRFVALRIRADEAVELYRQLGFEVRAEPVRAAELGTDCSDCGLIEALQFQTIYTRKKSSNP